ncbi:transporter substrate-binding domain-containing protein [Micromonospora rubida]
MPALIVSLASMRLTGLQVNKWSVSCWLSAETRLVNTPDGVDHDIRVTSGGRILPDPHVVTVRLLCRNRRDIPIGQFTANKPMEIPIGNAIVKILDVSGDEIAYTTSDDGTALLIGPDLIRRYQNTTWRLLTEGRPAPLTTVDKLTDVTVRLEDGDQVSARRRTQRSIALSTVAVLLTALGVALALRGGAGPDGDSASSYFGGTVQIGVTENLPGWSAPGANAQAGGFDNALIDHLSRPGGILDDKTVIRTRLTLAERTSALSEGRADIVIGVYSITPERSRVVDMAGPYYVDQRVLVGNGDKLTSDWRRTDGSPEIGLCQSSATKTGYGEPEYERLRAKVKGSGGRLTVTTSEDLTSCLQRFSQGDEIQAIMTDWSIIRSAFHGKLIDRNGAVVTDQTLFSPEDTTIESYGVAIRSNHPNVCKALQDELRSFLDTRWDTAFELNLAGAIRPPDAPTDYVGRHKPTSIPATCAT